MPTEINQPAHSLGFTKTMTSCAKGLALILLFVHHIIPNNPGVNLSIAQLSISQVLATSAKSCVSIFMILSGYGICFKLSKTDGSFSNMAAAICNRLRKFWSSFIPMYLFSLLVSVCVGVSVVSVYGKGFGFLLFLIKDMFGLASEFFSSPTLCGAWWYLGAAICCYVLAPFFYMVISKGKLVNCILLLVAYTPWLVYLIVDDPNMHTDRELFYIFAFVLGMTACKRGLFVKFLECRNTYKYPLAGIVLLGLCVARFKLNLMVDSFIAFCLILLMTQIAREDSPLGSFFKYLGESSGNVYMFHVSILGVLGSVPFVNHWVEIIFSLFLCLSINAMLVEIRRNLFQLIHS